MGLFDIFKKRKIEKHIPYEEHETRCDMCEYLLVCKPDLLDITLRDDCMKHYTQGPNTKCIKDN